MQLNVQKYLDKDLDLGLIKLTLLLSITVKFINLPLCIMHIDIELILTFSVTSYRLIPSRDGSNGDKEI